MPSIEEIKFRPYKPEDLPQIEWLNKHAYDPAVYERMDFDDSDVAEFADSYNGTKGLFLVGEYGKAFVAMGGFCRISDDVAELRRMRVNPSPTYRRRGVGGRLLTLLENEAIGRGYKVMVMDTVAEQEGVVEFYKGHGYAETHRDSSFEQEAIFFVKALAAATAHKRETLAIKDLGGINIPSLYAELGVHIQELPYTCAQGAILGILNNKKVNHSWNETDLAELCGAREGVGTPDKGKLLEACEETGLEVVESKQDASIDDIEHHIKANSDDIKDPDNVFVIVNYIDAFAGVGHYGAIFQQDEKAFYLVDPTFGLLRLEKPDFEANWHNTSGEIQHWFAAVR
jgi:ribosomal protein S18 acetylase RimI-like enzyme